MRWSPAKFKVLANFLMQEYGKKGVSVHELIEAQMAKAQRNGMELTYEQAFEEVIADSMEAMLADGKVMDKLSKLRAKDQSLWAKLKEAITELANKIRELYASLKPDSKEGQYVAQMKDSIEKIQELFTDALIDASENYQAANGQKNTAQQDGRKNSLRDNEIRAIQNIGRKSVNDFTSQDIKATEVFAKKYFQEMDVKSPFFRAWFGDWRAHDTTSIRVANQSGDSRSVQKNTDTGWDINVSGFVFNETNVHTDSPNKAARRHLFYINDIVRKAVLLDSYAIPKDDAKSINSLLMHSLYAVADAGNGLEILKLYVEEMNDPNSTDTAKRAYQLQNVEKYRILHGVHSKSVSSISAGSGVTTVADLFAAVKSRDKNFNPKAVNSVLLNADGTPKIFYHGTNERFTVFNPEEMSPREGSFFFAENREDAQAYGDKVYQVYLQGDNLADYDNQPSEFYRLRDKRKQVQWLKDRGYDGWYADMDSDGWGELSVFKNTQVKSATDNIGTFAPNNPDIRYSTRDPELQKANAVLEKENSQLREDVQELKTLLKLQRQVTNGTKFTKSSVEAAARYLKSAVNAKGDTKEFAGLLNEFYEYIASGGEITWETVSNMAQPAIQWLHEHQKQERNDYAQDILKQIRGTKVYLDQQQKQEAAHAYGSYNNFRKSLMGTITLSDSANMSLDSAWHEWSQEYPYLFKDSVSASDMPVDLAKIYRSRCPLLF